MTLCVLAVLLLAGVAAVILLPHRLAARKPLHTHPDNIADPLPLSTAQKMSKR